MAKRNRIPKAKNKIQGSGEGALVKLDGNTAAFVEAPQGDRVKHATTIVRSTLLSAELETIIEIIARERVYRAMLARRLLTSPYPSGPPHLRIAE